MQIGEAFVRELMSAMPNRQFNMDSSVASWDHG